MVGGLTPLAPFSRSIGCFFGRSFYLEGVFIWKVFLEIGCFSKECVSKQCLSKQCVFKEKNIQMHLIDVIIIFKNYIFERMNSNTRKKCKTRKRRVKEDSDDNDNDNDSFNMGHLFNKFISYFTDDNEEKEDVKREVKTRIKKVKIIEEEKREEDDSDQDPDENGRQEIVVKKQSRKMRITQKNR